MGNLLGNAFHFDFSQGIVSFPRAPTAIPIAIATPIPSSMSSSKSTVSTTTEDKASYLEMTMAAVQALRARKGASRAAIARWIQINFEKEGGSAFNSYLRTAIKKGLESGVLREGETAQRFKIGELPKAVKKKKKTSSKKKSGSKKKTASKKKSSSKKKTASKK